MSKNQKRGYAAEGEVALRPVPFNFPSRPPALKKPSTEDELVSHRYGEWKAEVTDLGWWGFRIRYTNGVMERVPYDHVFTKWGMRQKVRRKLHGLNREAKKFMLTEKDVA